MLKLIVNPKFDYETVSYDKESEIHLDFVLHVPEKPEEARIPIQLFLVIDCSVSMSGNKIQAVKQTTLKLVKHLTAQDSLGIISFSHKAWSLLDLIPMTDRNKKKACNIIQRLEPLSNTNLGEAIELAAKKAAKAEKTKVTHIILLTDGIPSYGVCDQLGLENIVRKNLHSVTMSTFGYGYDFDAELMASLSRLAHGNIFYIKEDADCDKAFALELGGLLSLFAKNIKLEIVPSQDVQFIDFLSDYVCPQKKERFLKPSSIIEVFVDNIFSGETKHIIFKLRIPTMDRTKVIQKIMACFFNVSYIRVEDNVSEYYQNSCSIQYTDNFQKMPNEEVQKQIFILEAARMQQEAQNKAQQGDLPGAQCVLKTGEAFFASKASILKEDANVVSSMFKDLSNNYENEEIYAKKGLKLSKTYSTSLFSGRNTSVETKSKVNLQQKKMLGLFNPDKNAPLNDVYLDCSNISISDSKYHKGDHSTDHGHSPDHGSCDSGSCDSGSCDSGSCDSGSCD